MELGPGEKVSIVDNSAREALQAQLAHFDRAITQLEQLRKPFDTAIAAVQEVRDALLEQHGVEVLGNCESCGCFVLAGDLGHRCAEGELLCLQCAPTFAEIKAEYADLYPDSMEPEERQAAIDLIAAKEAAAELDQKHVWQL